VGFEGVGESEVRLAFVGSFELLRSTLPPLPRRHRPRIRPQPTLWLYTNSATAFRHNSRQPASVPRPCRTFNPVPTFERAGKASESYDVLPPSSYGAGGFSGWAKFPALEPTMAALCPPSTDACVEGTRQRRGESW